MVPHSNIKHGYLRGGLDSLIESAVSFKGVLDEIRTDVGKDHLDLVGLFSSRGSFPFLEALNYLEKNGEDNLRFRIIPHIFSIENLAEIITNYQKYSREHHTLTLYGYYNEIAKHMSKKIKNFCTPDSETILTDWDEICTGRNIVQRSKIYSQLKFSPKVPFYLISFINKPKLESPNVNRFKKNFRTSPKNFKTLDVLLDSDISWSDNEDFFSEIGLEYPNIAVPNSQYLYSLVKKEAILPFYTNFFHKFSEELAKEIGSDSTNLNYKLVQTLIGSNVANHSDIEVTLKCSHNAFMGTMNVLSKKNMLKDKRVLDARYEFDIDKAQVIRHGAKKQVLLHRNMTDHYEHAEYPFYRSPFTLFYDPRDEDLCIFDNLLNEFLWKYNTAIGRDKEDGVIKKVF